MNNLTIPEKYSRHWPAISIASAVLTVLFWVAYMVTTDTLAEGYFRFAAFCFFALSLLSFFKVRDGRIKINLSLSEDGGLELDYFSRGKQIAQDTFDLNRFESVETVSMPNRTLYNDFATDDRTVRFKKKDSDEWLYLAEVNGRVIPLDHINANKVADFLRLHLDKAD
ncbi:MAG: hypothetical protein WD317_07810 [Balneolaceae bacterium]